VPEHEYPSPLVEVTVQGEVRGRTYRHLVWLPKAELFRVQAVFKHAEYALPRYRGPQRPRVVLDIGANVGLFSLYMKVLDPEAVVHCYEPAPATVALLQKNVGQLPAVQIHPYALAALAGRAAMHLHRANTGQHSLRKIEPSDQYGDDVEIDCHDAAEEFDRLNAERIDVLKIDTEGCEIDILKCLGPRIEQVDCVLLEYHSEADRRRIDQYLASFLLYSARSSRIGRGTLKYVHRRLVLRPG